MLNINVVIIFLSFNWSIFYMEIEFLLIIYKDVVFFFGLLECFVGCVINILIFFGFEMSIWEVYLENIFINCFCVCLLFGFWLYYIVFIYF